VISTNKPESNYISKNTLTQAYISKPQNWREKVKSESI
jgi:hypothetical protein